MTNKQIVTIFVGPPCVGKTTYRDQHTYDYVISSDDIVTDLCLEFGLSYRQFFQLSANSEIKYEKNKRFEASIAQSQHEKHVVWDLTNLTVTARKSIMQHYPNAEFNAVVFEFKGFEATILARNTIRSEATDKSIPPNIILSMMQSYEPVSLSEGFSSLIHVRQPVQHD